MSAEVPGVTPRTPGLDPDRATTAATAVKAAAEDKGTLTWAAVADAALIADDARARSRGLVATGDGLTREALRLAIGAASVLAGQKCGAAEDGDIPSALCPVCNARRFLAALPSSLLDNPEADRGN